MKKTQLLLMLLVGATIVLAGCSPQENTVPTSPTEQGTPSDPQEEVSEESTNPNQGTTIGEEELPQGGFPQ